MAQDSLDERARINRHFFDLVPLNQAMGITLEDLGRGTARLVLPYRRDLVGDPVSGVLHGGAITALMDAACGAAVFMALPERVPIATLDLRIDYLRRGEPGADVICDAEVIRTTRSVAFTRAIAHHGDPADPVAAAAGAFMVGTHVPGRGEAR